MRKQNRVHSSCSKQKLSQFRETEDELETMLELLYHDCVGHPLTSVQCSFLDTSDLYIYMEGTHSPSEHFLEAWGSSDLAKRMRQAINQIIKEKINTTLEKDLSIKTDTIRLLKPERPEQLNVLVNFHL
ncbi:MAG: Na-translocating system protein MpsC family protein [Phormidesmis sp.]